MFAKIVISLAALGLLAACGESFKSKNKVPKLPKNMLVTIVDGECSDLPGGEYVEYVKAGGRVVMGIGQVAGNNMHPLGQVGGMDQVALTESQMPAHSHDRPRFQPGGSSAEWAIENKTAQPSSTPTQVQSSSKGRGLAHNNLQPFITLRQCIHFEFVDLPVKVQ